ncbi:MAG: lasso peptide biosynthesis B2 protein [Acidobacteriota bacterium]
MVNQVSLKPGVLFVQTFSGGTLMDVAGDRFIALTPLSAALWSGAAAGQDADGLVRTIARQTSATADAARALLGRQLDAWERAGLVNPRERPSALPTPRPEPLAPPREWPAAEARRFRASPLVMARLFAAERQYRYAVASEGLASALVRLQRETHPAAPDPHAITLRTVRAYQAVRRAFRQGRTATDCLFRSLALAAVLRRRGVSADLCIGIVDVPFAAHAWVESGGVVLNESLARRLEFVTIGRF